MKDIEILQLADQCGVVAVTKHEWDGKQFNHTDDYLDGDAAALVIFAKVVAQHEREACAKICQEQSELQLDERVMRGIDVCKELILARGNT